MKTMMKLILAALLVSGCAFQVTEATVKRQKRDNHFLKQEIHGAKQSMRPLQDYVAALEKGQMPHDGFFLMISPKDVTHWGRKAYLPYAFPAKSIHNKISGTFTTKNINNVRFLHSNRLAFRMYLRGRKIGVHYKGDMYKPHIKKIKAGLQAGMAADVVVSLSLKGGKLVARPKCVDINLRKHNSSTYRSNIKSAINKRFSKTKYVINLPSKSGLSPKYLLTTKNHVIVAYR